MFEYYLLFFWILFWVFYYLKWSGISYYFKNWISDQNTAKADFQLYFRISNVEVQVPGLDSNACVSILTCPLRSDETYTFKYSAFIPKSVPTVSYGFTIN
jgi:hypothetical protein